uniref:ORF IV n=1 Tax=Cassava vein mosaic virus TaxID=38062 RepID=Q66276_CSVMV|nr:ORF IV [Cassava vein mosaic virus]
MEDMMKQILEKLNTIEKNISETNIRIEKIEKEQELKRKVELYGKEPEKKLHKENIEKLSSSIEDKIIQNIDKKLKKIENVEEQYQWKNIVKINKPLSVGEKYMENFKKILVYLGEKHPKLEELYSLTDYNKLVADIYTDRNLVISAYNYGLLQVLYIEHPSQLELFDENIKLAYMKFRNVTRHNLYICEFTVQWLNPMIKG